MSEVIYQDQRLPKREIIRKRDQFHHIFEKGKRWHGSCLRFFFLEAESRQVGFAVPRKLGNAVRRNRFKRWMREAYRRHKYELGAYAVIILARPVKLHVKYRDIDKDIQSFCFFLKGENQ